MFKNTLCCEKYLSTIDNFEVRKCFTAFRISSHNLAIERGRYRHIEVNDRKCNICKNGEVEDELHFLFGCNKYTDKRKIFLEFIFNKCKNFKELFVTNKLIWLMSCEDNHIILEFAKYIFDCFNIRTMHTVA